MAPLGNFFQRPLFTDSMSLFSATALATFVEFIPGFSKLISFCISE
jgi:hypothetical protein